MQQHVLIVEDREDVREIVTLLLGASGFDVVAVGTCSEAREIWGGHPLRYDVVISDLELPDGNGLLFLQDVRRVGTTRILMSGDLDDVSVEVAESEGIAVLPKPFALGTLIDMLRMPLSADVA